MSVESNNQKSSDHRFHAGSVFQHESDIIIDLIIKNGCNCCWFLEPFFEVLDVLLHCFHWHL